MSFDYVLDLFGEFRKGKKTRFTDVETTAKDLLDKFVKGEISNKDFADGFVSVGKRFTEPWIMVMRRFSMKIPHCG